jgi:hypothetical protein
MKPLIVRLLLAFLGILLSGTVRNAGAGETNSVAPKAPAREEMKLSWTGAPTFNSCSVEWDGKALVYKRTEIGRTVEQTNITATAETWTKFWKKLEDVRVWEWQAHYDNPRVLDGQVWEVKLAHGGRKVEVFGRNSYPGGEKGEIGGSAGSKLYAGYLSAVEELIGRKIWDESYGASFTR